MTQETHEALLLAEMLGFVQSITPMPQDAARLLRQQHALIVQMAEALNGAESSLDDYNHGAPWGQYDLDNFRRVEAANHTATQYLKAKP